MKYKINEIDFENLPLKLKKIKNPPKKLYAIGNTSLLYEECFAIVGTRRISEYGIKNCQAFTKEFSLRNIPIVSGMAVGTDSVSHKTCLKYENHTIAVLGSGFNEIFPEKNIGLFSEIIEKDGLVITEYERDVEPTKENFPKRNRIITGLSEGVLVIEGAYRSGTSITAKIATEQGKLVFAIPGKLDSTVGVGVNRLIKEGAILTTSINDILEKYPNFNSRKRRNELRVNVKKEYREIYNFIDEGKYFDEILEHCNKEIQELFKMLSQMELEELIYQDIDGKYKKVDI